jgi:hypothetical protein
MRLVFAMLLLLAMPCVGSAEQQSQKASASQKRGICGEIVKEVDPLLYDDSRHHAPTTTCSYTDERLLITARGDLTEDRMKRFVFLAFTAVGMLRNDDYMLPDKVYVGRDTTCQVMATNDAAMLNRAARDRTDSGLIRAMMLASGALTVMCPK